MTPSPRPRRAALLAAAALLLAATGCGEGGARIVVGGGTAGGGDTTRTTGLVGRWSRTILFSDGTGAVHSSETIWEFRADGTALRTLVTRNLTDGFADATTTVADWFTQGRVVVITFPPPSGGTVRFDFQIIGDTLTLGGTDFVRVRA